MQAAEAHRAHWQACGRGAATSARGRHAITEPSGTSRRAYILGTPYCGSTVFGQALGAHSGAGYLGEVDRVAGYPADGWPGESDPTCHYCEVRGEECPVWTPERQASVRSMPHGGLMDYFEAELGPQALVDGSKHPRWLANLVAQGAVDPQRTVVFLVVRSPFAYASSHIGQRVRPAWEAANIWRDVYYDAMRIVSRARLPLLVVRYEDFAETPEVVLRPATAMLGLDYEPDMLYFQHRPRHDIGGNYGALVRADQQVEYAAPGAAESGGGGRVKLPDADGTAQEKPFGRSVRLHWLDRLTPDDLDAIMETPGLGEIANLMGYHLAREVRTWQRQQSDAPPRPLLSIRTSAELAPESGDATLGSVGGAEVAGDGVAGDGDGATGDAGIASGSAGPE